MAINDHPDFDGRYMRWCEHPNVHEIERIGSSQKFYLCEDCGDWFPCIGDTDEWAPKLIGTRLDITKERRDG